MPLVSSKLEDILNNDFSTVGIVDPENTPNKQPKIWDDLGLLEIWDKAQDWFTGLTTNHLKKKYLVRKPAELAKTFENRIQSSNAENWWKQSIEAHTSILNSFEVLTESPKELQDEKSIVNLYNSTLKVWDSTITQMFFRDGTVVCGVGYSGLRPYLFRAAVNSVSVVEYEETENGNRLSRIAFKYEVDMFNATYVDYQLSNGQLLIVDWKEIDGVFEVVQITPVLGAGGQPLDEIPICTLSECDSLVFSKDNFPYPALHNVLEQNIVAFNKESELDTVESKLNMPTLVRFHLNKVPEALGPLFVGTSRVIEMIMGSDIKYLEPQGNGISLTHERQKHRESKLLAAQERLFNVNPQGGEKTATQSLLDAAQTKRILDTAIAKKQNLYQNLFRFWRFFSEPSFQLYDISGDPNYAGGVAFNAELTENIPDPQDISRTFDAVDSAILTPEQALNRLIRIGWVTEEDLEDQGLDMPLPAPIEPEQDDIENRDPIEDESIENIEDDN